MPKNNLKFTVVVDTNAIFTKDPTLIVSKHFDENWKKCCEFGEMHLALPEVVRGERLYQMVSVAEKSVQSAIKNFDTITKVSGRPMPKLPTPKQLKIGAERLFRKWATENKVNVVPVPYKKMSWPAIVNDAIWRKTPFVPSPENQDSEKGFRDKLIFETVREFLNAPRETPAVFVSNDTILREAIKDAHGTKLFAVHDEIDGFISYLKLTQEDLDNQFAETILQKCPTVFYSADNPECVYNKLNVPQKISEAWSFWLDFFVPPLPTIPGLEYLNPPQPLGLGAGTTYVPASKEKIFIDATQFNAMVPDKYEWKSTIRFVRLFRDAKQKPMAGLEWMYQIIRVATVDVLWQSVVDEDANFSDFSLGQIPMPAITSEPAASSWKYGTFEKLPDAQA